MNPLGLQAKEDVGKLVLTHAAAATVVADDAILAEHAAKITPRKEHGTRATRTADGRLLPRMGRGTGNEDLVSHTAKAVPFGRTVGMALAGAISATADL